jgi:tetratricopeptide (TPR) repeat protein
LIELLEGTGEMTGNRVQLKCSSEALEKFKEAIRKFPDFPFSYFALAVCLKNKADPEWRGYAEKALSIFEKTATLKEHHPSHDEALTELRRMLNQ